MPAPYPQELRDDVVAVARGRELGTTLKQVAKDSGIAEATLTNWMKVADVQEGTPAGSPRTRRRSCASCSGAPSCSSRRTRCCAARRPTSPRPT